MVDFIPRLPLADIIDLFVSWLTDNLSGVFQFISVILRGVVDGIEWLLILPPPIVLILLIGFIAWKTSKWRMALFSVLGLLLIWNLGYWEHMVQTLALVLTAVFVTIIVGIPIGIWASQKTLVRQIVTPILDLMQTMPAFVYLIPAIFFFNIGVVPGVVASVIFAMPPTIRLTILGIQQVPSDLIEATNAFGSTTKQRLLKVQIPLAMPTIMAGINQSIMLALSMVVIAAMVGAPGLGTEVYRAVTQIQTGVGFEAGLAIVIIAIILDRITQNIGNKKQGGTQ
ncbi:ABC transporter permease [Halalkalibacter alkaliphilus]|uniref:Proline/glycine betaine ABC transporter permease n=1 Tax=Halalkalibacter alkaliphilus TaxID=2917993 RepID=A0A9X2CSR5_9BACI|nr:proline/glycine betaine ABC transporter permease [Halalkalibacter alkaliphilus]MCL7747537.1 proline/glycine betaine ABC transporter permease [Halalkalibacter alkaliphilus]